MGGGYFQRKSRQPTKALLGLGGASSEEQRRELSADYKDVLNRLWKQSAGLPTRRER